MISSVDSHDNELTTAKELQVREAPNSNLHPNDPNQHPNKPGPRHPPGLHQLTKSLILPLLNLTGFPGQYRLFGHRLDGHVRR